MSAMSSQYVIQLINKETFFYGPAIPQNLYFGDDFEMTVCLSSLYEIFQTLFQVGALEACILAKKGYEVDLYEFREGKSVKLIFLRRKYLYFWLRPLRCLEKTDRSAVAHNLGLDKLLIFFPDIRQLEHVPGRSINLAMSIRGLSALNSIGLGNES